jgi:hypothetical protein
MSEQGYEWTPEPERRPDHVVVLPRSDLEALHAVREIFPGARFRTRLIGRAREAAREIDNG